MLSRKIDLGMHDAHMPRQRIAAAEGLLLGAQLAAYLLLLCIVNGILVSREIVRSREDGVARLAGARVDAVASVGPGLAVA